MNTTPLEAALDYALRGWRVLPIIPKKKSPPMKAWQDAATTDVDTINAWWTGLYRDGYGVGIATGEESGVWVLDVDVADGKTGDESLHDLEQSYSPLPDTVEAVTGRGGRHLFFAWPKGGEIRAGDAKQLGDGLDVRGVGGQVVAAPTISPTGTRYEWLIGHAPDEIDVAEAPEWLLALMETPEPAHTASSISAPSDDEDSPAAHFNQSTTWAELLTADGWTLGGTADEGEQRWVRPGKHKRDGTSATVGHKGRDVLKVFTSSVPGLDERGAYSRFGYLAATRFDGDRSECARQLRAGMPHPADPDWLVLDAVTNNSPQTTDDWPEPIPLGDAKDLPTFPVDVLPDWMARHATAVADELQMPVDLPAMMGLACLSTICARKARVHVRSTWYEQVNLYIAVAMPPSAGKSPAFGAMLGALKRFEKTQVDASEAEIAKAELAARMTEKELKRAEDKGDRHEAERLLGELLLHDVPKKPRITADDATPEALVDLLASQRGRIALLSTEGGVFDLMAGRYSEKANLDVYLKAWGGDDIIVDRIGRGESSVSSPSLTIGITVQPSVIAALAERPELAGRGLTARFMYSVPVDTVGQRNFLDQAEADLDVVRCYDDHISALATRMAQFLEPNTLIVDPGALRLFNQWRQQLEQRRSPDGDLRPLAEWSTKLESSVIRCAGLLHIADVGIANNATLGVEHMTRAIAIGDYWLAHAFAVHDMWGTDPVMTKAKAVMKWCEGRESFTVRELYSHRRAMFPRTEDTLPVLSLLLERGWLRCDEDWPPRLGKRGKPSPTLWINPSHASHATHATRKCAEDSDSHASHATHATRGPLSHASHESDSPRALIRSLSFSEQGFLKEDPSSHASHESHDSSNHASVDNYSPGDPETDPDPDDDDDPEYDPFDDWDGE